MIFTHNDELENAFESGKEEGAATERASIVVLLANPSEELATECAKALWKNDLPDGMPSWNYLEEATKLTYKYEASFYMRFLSELIRRGEHVQPESVKENGK
jgi:hypothetical protein